MRFNLADKGIGIIIEDLIDKGYSITHPEIYRRFKKGLLSKASFRDVDIAGKTKKSNIIYYE